MFVSVSVYERVMIQCLCKNEVYRFNSLYSNWKPNRQIRSQSFVMSSYEGTMKTSYLYRSLGAR